MTGQISEEKMSVYVRLGIRLLYKGLKSNNMENKRSKLFQESHITLLLRVLTTCFFQSESSSRGLA